jgi:hypothetical protein
VAKVFTNKAMRRALDTVFDNHIHVVINKPALQNLMFQSLGGHPIDYVGGMVNIASFLDRKVESEYLNHSKGMRGGYLRIKDWSKSELAAREKERLQFTEGLRIRDAIVDGLKAQIDTVMAKPVRSFVPIN